MLLYWEEIFSNVACMTPSKHVCIGTFRATLSACNTTIRKWKRHVLPTSTIRWCRSRHWSQNLTNKSIIASGYGCAFCRVSYTHNNAWEWTQQTFAFLTASSPKIAQHRFLVVVYCNWKNRKEIPKHDAGEWVQSLVVCSLTAVSHLKVATYIHAINDAKLHLYMKSRFAIRRCTPTRLGGAYRRTHTWALDRKRLRNAR
jgi:hypothetical protein